MPPASMPLPPAPAPERAPDPRPPRSRPRRVMRRLATSLAVAVGAYYALCLLLLLLYRFVSPPITGVQLQRRIEAAVAARDYDPVRRPVPLARLPRHVGRAVVAAEDGGFWNHNGFDTEAMRDATREAIGGEGLRGASTITQQLMKNLFGTTSRNPLRKLMDYALTPPAELLLGKSRILELYLNTAEWGDGVWGIEAAARHHYGVPAARLSRTQAAGLAALLPAPRTRTPATTGWYRAEILRRMRHRGW